MKRFCVICGKELNIILGEPINGEFKIISGGYFFRFTDENRKLFDIKSIDEQTEYWECEECYND